MIFTLRMSATVIDKHDTKIYTMIEEYRRLGFVIEHSNNDPGRQYIPQKEYEKLDRHWVDHRQSVEIAFDSLSDLLFFIQQFGKVILYKTSDERILESEHEFCVEIYNDYRE